MASAGRNIALLLSVATVAHILGWTLWGSTIFGGLVLGLGAILTVWAGLTFATQFSERMARYDQRFPHAAARFADLPRPKVRESMYPFVCAAAVGFVGYFSFLGHTFNHVFHEGNWIIGGIAGWSIGTLVHMQRTWVSAPADPRPDKPSRRRKR